MELSSDISLTHPLWDRVDEELCNNKDLGIFNRLVDIYMLACAIGIKADKTITEIEHPLDPAKSIGRNTHRGNEDVRRILDFMLQNAIILTTTIDLDTNTRLELAFNPDFNIKKFSPANFLTGFANYGIEEIYKQIESKSSLVIADNLYEYFNSFTESSYDALLSTLTLEDIIKNS